MEKKMSRTIRRGKPSRNFHKYIGLGLLRCENERTHLCISYPGGWHNEIVNEPYWMDDKFTEYDAYAEFNIREYHMDYRRWTKCPGMYHREDTMRQKRKHKIEMYRASRTEDYDVILSPRVNEAERMWDWY